MRQVRLPYVFFNEMIQFINLDPSPQCRLNCIKTLGRHFGASKIFEHGPLTLDWNIICPLDGTRDGIEGEPPNRN